MYNCSPTYYYCMSCYVSRWMENLIKMKLQDISMLISPNGSER